MRAIRPNGGYVFHGGCSGCDNDISICPTCKYMEPNWSLPDRNPVNIRSQEEKIAMMEFARAENKKLTKLIPYFGK